MSSASLQTTTPSKMSALQNLLAMLMAAPLYLLSSLCPVLGFNSTHISLQELTKTVAGSSVTLEWHHEGRSSEAIDPTHKGPVLTYLAKVPDATTATSPSSLNWFKM